ncbi:hypothetical protein [Paraburkholderia sp. SIMBA_054]|uniref:hypothetical protein n=1 Tax=Paraburkholderia sp. SIMBA_054 TaxID=3085795 RepID=UPI00397CB911
MKRLIFGSLLTFAVAAQAASGTYTPEGNTATVLGVDSEHRGFRDDVWQLINDTYAGNPAVQAGAEAVARSYQNSIGPVALNTVDTSAMVLQDAQVGACAAYNAGPAHAAELIQAMHEVYARTFNTEARITARRAYVSAGKNVGAIHLDYKKCAETANR